MNKEKDEDARDYNDIPSDQLVKAPVEEGDVQRQGKDDTTSPLGQAQSVNEAPDSPFVDGNIEPVNDEIEDTAEES